ncbi:hypothetical protein [Sphingomonas sp. TDK1]|uniref:hypothetical protein n=1 Tax=Sphingomonas sp. TDK1 TaxID=453247 RepID=UPI000AB81A8C|nr:hypothetical protein [Sphingomonas sp. TDK1]
MNIIRRVCLSVAVILPISVIGAPAAEAQTLNGSAGRVCGVTVSGAAVGYKGVAFTNVTIDLVTTSGQSIRLATNVVVENGKYSWAGIVPGLAAVPAGSKIKLTTNRQYSTTIDAPTCQS